MAAIIIIIGLIIGIILNVIINKISICIDKNEIIKNRHMLELTIKSISIVIICTTLNLISFLKFGLCTLFVFAVLLNLILIVVSCIDLKYHIIPNKIVIFTLILGIIFAFTLKINLVNVFLGMITGSGIIFLLALIPKAMGGGDVKLMFSLGLFLGFPKVIWAICLAFIFAAIISIILLIFKIKKCKDSIPFGPFLALGCFIVFNFITS